ncbi:MAG: hypothetical protein JWR24_4962 [Actinoallomurus sp.]|nr:hypothetical protein [Actinoallomurus sp.]
MAAPEWASEEEHNAACYVYGIVPGDVESTPDARGLGDRPVTVVRHGEIAALVSEIHPDDAIGTPQDLKAHDELLNATVIEAPVLPLRFGAVMTTPEAVAEELLAPHHDQFLAALEELEGRAEYIVKGRYVERAVLTELLAENDEAARLREEIGDTTEDATRDVRMRLGEIIQQGLAAKRDADTDRFMQALSPHSVATAVREPTHEQDAVHVALLVETARRSDFEDALDGLARGWEERIDLRLRGPLAPYDFVVKPN